MLRLSSFLLTLSLVGCASFTAPESIKDDTLRAPESWSAGHVINASNNYTSALTRYSELSALISEALINNPQLGNQKLSVDLAVESLKQTNTGEWPKIDAFLSSGRQEANNNISNSTSLRADVNWELDFLGKLDDKTKAATLDAKQAVLGYQQQQTQTVTLITQQWFNLIFTQSQYELIEKRKANLQENLDIIEDGYNQGVNQPLDVYLARADVARAKASAQENLTSLKNAQRDLELSLGRYPAADIVANGDLSFASTPVPAGMPSTLLQRRFDLQQAQLKLEAENYRLANAYKQRFPSLSLSLSGGQSSQELKNLFKPDNLIWSIFANASAPIFDAGFLASQQEQQAIKAKQAANAITTSTLQAFIEVENALTAEVTLAEREKEQAEATRYFMTAEKLAFEQYIAGLSAYITVLESQRSAYDAQTTLLSIKNARIQNRVNLLQALGGDIPEQAQDYLSDQKKEINRVAE